MSDTIPEEYSLSAYHYTLPGEQIAQHPVDCRDASRLLVLNRVTAERQHLHFSDLITVIAPGDLLVVNNTRVFPARLHGKKETGGRVEIFLLEYPHQNGDKFTAPALLKASKRPKAGAHIRVSRALVCSVRSECGNGRVELELHCDSLQQLAAELESGGEIPLPPYIERQGGSTDEDRQRYQTVYARTPGAVAAPTAGLHFTPELLAELEQKGVNRAAVTLHVGYGTFAPVRVEDIRSHQIHSEYLSVTRETVDAVQQTKAAGGKVWAVGTTTVRALEFCARQKNTLTAITGWCDLYIYPGFDFKVVDRLVTNFHLPDSSLMFLVSAFCDQQREGESGRQLLLETYREAVAKSYRFFSYGDAMAIID